MTNAPSDPQETPAAAPDGAPDDGFVRVHPISPFIRGGLVVLAVTGYLVTQQLDRLASAFADPSFGGDDDGPYSLLLQAAAVALAIVGAFLLGLASWWFTRYRLGPQSLELRTGAVFRQHRQVRYDRIQAVDLVRPLLARLAGLAEVRVESAGGGDSHVSISYLPQARAEAVRVRLLGLAHQAGAPADEAQPLTTGTEPVRVQDTSRHLLTVPVSRLVASVVLSWESIWLVVLVVVALVLVLFDLAPVVGGFLPLVLLTGVRAVLRLTRWYGLTISQRDATLNSQRGLTDTRSSTVPLHRVQAVEIRQPLLWRRAGWWSVMINVAGAQIFGSSDTDGSEKVLIPVATRGEMIALLQLLTANEGTDGEVSSLIGGTPPGFVGQPRRARWLHPFAHRRIGYLVGGRALLTRGGWTDHVVQVVPWGRIQSLTVHQGLVARRLELASVDLVSTVGPVSPRVRHLSVTDALVLLDLARKRSGAARHGERTPVVAVRRPTRWTGPDE